MLRKPGGIVFAAVVLAAGLVSAGIISGQITAVSTDGTSITVETPKGSQTFKVGEKQPITLDDKTIKRDQLVVGQKISIFTDSANRPTKFIARSESKTTPKPDPAPKTTPVTSARTRPTTGEGGDWPQFLGPNRDNISTEKGLLRKWPEGGPRLLWTATGLGSGYSSVAIAEGIIYTMGNRGQTQSLLAMELDSGKGKWEATVGRAFSEGNGDGPRGTPAASGGMVYGLGATGELTCADAKNGGVLWSKNILQEFGGRSLGWGISESVLLDGDRLVCTPGGPQATVVAFDRKSGNLIWKAVAPQGDTAAYASLVKAEVGGVAQYVTLTNQGTIGIRADDGKFLWRDDSAANGVANCSSPAFFNDMVFSASGYGHGGAMVKLASMNGETTAKFGYHTREMKSHHGGFVIVDGYVYGSNEGVFVCLDLKSGQVKWQSRNPGKGSVTCADGMLIVRNEGGLVTLVQASPAGYRELGRFDQPERSGNSAWAYPVVSHGRLFLRDMDKLLCYELRK